MTTKDKSHTPTQTELIEAELEPILRHIYPGNVGSGRDNAHSRRKREQAKKDLAALILKHRHDVYFQAYRDGLQQGRKEAQAMLDSSEEE